MPERSRGARPVAPSSSSSTDEPSRPAGSFGFTPALETEFARLQLAENRTLIRVTALVALLLAGARGAEQILLDAWTQRQVGQFAVVVALSIVLAALPWSPWFQRIYLPCARVLVPVRGAMIALTVAGVAARGQVGALVLLPVLVIGPFLVFGLSFRAAAVTVTLTITVYTVAAVSFGLALPLILRSCILLVAVAAACGVVARTLERTARARFLETHAMAELAQHDALTGVKNRRVFDAQLEQLWRRAADQVVERAFKTADSPHTPH